LYVCMFIFFFLNVMASKEKGNKTRKEKREKRPMNSKKRKMYKRKMMLKTKKKEKEINAKEREEEEEEEKFKLSLVVFFLINSIDLAFLSQFMCLLSNMNEKIVFIRFLFSTLSTTKRILRGIMQLFMCTVHRKIFEDNFTMKTFE